MNLQALAHRVPPLALWAALCLLPSCSAEPASPGPDAAEDPAPVAVTVFTDEVQLFMEYPRLVPGREGRFLAHVTVLASGEPVRAGRLTLELRREDGSAESFEARQPTRDGLFIPLVSLREPGSYGARIVVAGGEVEATIPLEPIVVYPDLASAFAAAAAESEDEPPDAVPFLLEQQWQVPLLLEQVRTRTLVRRLQAPGEVAARPGAAAVVAAPAGGRLAPPAEGVLPRLGDRVERGQILGFLEPPLSVSDLAQLSANAIGLEALDMELLLREFDLQASALEIERALFQALARLEFAQQALARLEGLRAQGLGTEAELEAARRDAELARREHEGARGLEESYRQALARLVTLGDRSSRARPAGQEPMRVPLIAPISGEIVEAGRVEGEHVEAGAGVYRLLDLERAWLTVRVSEFDLHALEGSSGALVEFAGHPGRSFDVLADLRGRLVGLGREVDPQDRTVPLRYEVQGPEGLLRAGMFADVFLETATVVDAIALPREALVMDEGRPVAFVLLEGELFQKRLLELGVEDGSWIEVEQGLAAGERVVTRGAYLVRLASASPAALGEGHAH